MVPQTVTIHLRLDDASRRYLEQECRAVGASPDEIVSWLIGEAARDAQFARQIGRRGRRTRPAPRLRLLTNDV